LFADGLHFSESGSMFVYNKLKEEIDPIVEKLPLVYPDWKEIDLDDRTQSLL